MSPLLAWSMCWVAQCQCTSSLQHATTLAPLHLACRCSLSRAEGVLSVTPWSFLQVLHGFHAFVMPSKTPCRRCAAV